jgi:SAM-dependent methyltransferase
MEAGPIGDSPERFDPESDGGTLMATEHLARYQWAAQVAPGARVLDAGCGSGYGTGILAAAEPATLIAVDVAQDAVELTRAALGDGVDVRVADVRELPLSDGAVDLVVCFEVIEHLERRDQALREFARVLAPGGVLLISSPNRNQYPPGNEHHVYEYTPEELEAEVSAQFPNVRMHRQHAWLASAIAAPDALVAASDRGVEVALRAASAEAAAREEIFTVAVASDGELPELAPLAVIGDPFEVKWFTEQLRNHRAEVTKIERLRLTAEREVGRQHERLQELGRRQLEAEQVQAELLDARAEIAAAGVKLEELRMEAAHYRMVYERADRVVADMQASPSWKLTAPLRALKRLLGS